MISAPTAMRNPPTMRGWLLCLRGVRVRLVHPIDVPGQEALPADSARRGDGTGATVLTRRLHRKQMLPFFSKLFPCLIAMAVCGTADPAASMATNDAIDVLNGL